MDGPSKSTASNKPEHNRPPKTDSSIQYKSSVIGVETAKRQDLFAEQNRRLAKKRAKDRQTRKIVFIILGVIGGLAVIGLITWLLIVLFTNQDSAPTDLTLGGEGATVIQEEAETILTDTGSVDNVTEYFDEKINSETNVAAKNDMVIIEMSLYTQNGYAEKVITSSERIDASTLTDEQFSIYGSLLVNAYINVGDVEKSNEYIQQLYDRGLLETTGVSG